MPATMSGLDQQPPIQGDHGIETKEFLERALVSASEWTRHADPKVLAVLVLLGLGSKDLIDHSGRLLAPHEESGSKCDLIGVIGHTCAGLVATSSGIIAGLLATASVLLVTQALFSRSNTRARCSVRPTLTCQVKPGRSAIRPVADFRAPPLGRKAASSRRAAATSAGATAALMPAADSAPFADNIRA